MTDIMKVGDTINAKETMSSLEIAALTGKQHSNVMRDIRNMLEQLEDRAGFIFELGTYKDANQQDRPCYNLTKKDCLLIASGYDANLRAKIINRWEELELEKRSLFKVPTSFAEALRLAAEKQEEIERQQTQIGEMSIKMSELEKKSDYLDIILQSKETVTVTQLSADYGMSAKAMNKKLAELGIQHKVNGQWILYAKYLGEGYVHSKTVQFKRSNGSMDTVMLTEWRQKGRIFLYNKLKENGIIPLIEQ